MKPNGEIIRLRGQVDQVAADHRRTEAKVRAAVDQICSIGNPDAEMIRYCTKSLIERVEALERTLNGILERIDAVERSIATITKACGEIAEDAIP